MIPFWLDDHGRPVPTRPCPRRLLPRPEPSQAWANILPSHAGFGHGLRLLLSLPDCREDLGLELLHLAGETVGHRLVPFELPARFAVQPRVVWRQHAVGAWGLGARPDVVRDFFDFRNTLSPPRCIRTCFGRFAALDDPRERP
jgi:hypothetical protein